MVETTFSLLILGNSLSSLGDSVSPWNRSLSSPQAGDSVSPVSRVTGHVLGDLGWEGRRRIHLLRGQVKGLSEHQ